MSAPIPEDSPSAASPDSEFLDLSSVPSCYLDLKEVPKRCTVNTVYGGDGALLTSTREVVSQWGEYIEDLLNPTDTPSDEEAESDSSDMGPHISGAEVAEAPWWQGPRGG